MVMVKALNDGNIGNWLLLRTAWSRDCLQLRQQWPYLMVPRD